MDAKTFIKEIKTAGKTYVTICSTKGKRKPLLTLSKKQKGYKYFIGIRPGGVGLMVYKACCELEALKLIEEALEMRGA